MDFIIEIFKFLKVRKKFWLLPIFIVLAIFGGLIVLSQGSVVAPFIYTIFKSDTYLVYPLYITIAVTLIKMVNIICGAGGKVYQKKT